MHRMQPKRTRKREPEAAFLPDSASTQGLPQIYKFCFMAGLPKKFLKKAHVTKTEETHRIRPRGQKESSSRSTERGVVCGAHSQAVDGFFQKQEAHGSAQREPLAFRRSNTPVQHCRNGALQSLLRRNRKAALPSSGHDSKMPSHNRS